MEFPRLAMYLHMVSMVIGNVQGVMIMLLKFAGALQITLEDVYHSPVGSKDGVGDKKGRLWYGSLGVLEQWEKYIDKEADPKESRLVEADELPAA